MTIRLFGLSLRVLLSRPMGNLVLWVSLCVAGYQFALETEIICNRLSR